MKPGPATKHDKRNKKSSKIVNDDDILENYDVIAFFPIYGQFGAIRNPYIGRIVVKLIFSLIVTFYLTKNANRTNTEKSLTQLSHYCFE